MLTEPEINHLLLILNHPQEPGASTIRPGRSLRAVEVEALVEKLKAMKPVADPAEQFKAICEEWDKRKA